MDALETSRTRVAAQFEPLFAELEAERALAEAIRDKAKELDRCYRSLASVLNGVHSTRADQLDDIIGHILPILNLARSNVRQLAQLVPEHQYYRWCDEFSYAFKNLTSCIALVVLLRTGVLVTKPQVAHILGLKSVDKARLQLATEDYLHGVINMINELPRLAVNSVTLGECRTPVRLASFVKHLHAGFQLLNLKNDSLRKRFDAIKYDVKKIEEVVYDISLRGLVKGPDEPGDGVAFPLEPAAQHSLVHQLAHDAV